MRTPKTKAQLELEVSAESVNQLRAATNELRRWRLDAIGARATKSSEGKPKEPKSCS